MARRPINSISPFFRRGAGRVYNTLGSTASLAAQGGIVGGILGVKGTVGAARLASRTISPAITGAASVGTIGGMFGLYGAQVAGKRIGQVSRITGRVARTMGGMARTEIAGTASAYKEFYNMTNASVSRGASKASLYGGIVGGSVLSTAAYAGVGGTIGAAVGGFMGVGRGGIEGMQIGAGIGGAVGAGMGLGLKYADLGVMAKLKGAGSAGLSVAGATIGASEILFGVGSTVTNYVASTRVAKMSGKVAKKVAKKVLPINGSLGSMVAGAGIGALTGSIFGDTGAAVLGGAAAGAVFGTISRRLTGGLTGLAAKHPIAAIMGGALALTGMRSGAEAVKWALKAEPPSYVGMGSNEEVYGMSSNNMNTAGLSLAAHYSR